jgi:hypothetical protein
LTNDPILDKGIIIREIVFMIDAIKQKAAAGQYEYSRHADDKYGPSCLLFGVTEAGRPLHIQCSYPDRLLIKIITVYEPDKDLWIDYKIRRK